VTVRILLRFIAASNDEFSGEFWIIRLISTIGSFLQKRSLAETVPTDWVWSTATGSERGFVEHYCRFGRMGEMSAYDLIVLKNPALRLALLRGQTGLETSSLFMRGLGLAWGSAWPSCEGFGRWRRGGTRLLHRLDLSGAGDPS